MATAKPTVSPRIKSPGFYDKIFSSRTGGCQSILDMFPNLYTLTLDELRGVFGESELSLIIDLSNGVLPVPQVIGQALAGQIADGIALSQSDKKWDINGPELIKKINNLSIFQAAALEIWAVSFWQGGWRGDAEAEPDLGNYISRLI